MITIAIVGDLSRRLGLALGQAVSGDQELQGALAVARVNHVVAHGMLERARTMAPDEQRQTVAAAEIMMRESEANIEAAADGVPLPGVSKAFTAFFDGARGFVDSVREAGSAAAKAWTVTQIVGGLALAGGVALGLKLWLGSSKPS